METQKRHGFHGASKVILLLLSAFTPFVCVCVNMWVKATPGAPCSAPVSLPVTVVAEFVVAGEGN